MRAARGLTSVPLVTTWPCFTEAMYLLGEVGGFAYQSLLWRLYQSDRLSLHVSAADEVARMAEVMERYADLPMDLADASLVAAAEALKLQQVFAVDQHFRVYRMRDGSTLELLP